MKIIKTVLAASALLASGGAFAAINENAVHLALDSLLVATSKMSVVNAINTTGKPPSTNAEAHLGAPSTMTTTEISGIVVGNGGAINIYLAPVTGTNHGLIQLSPQVMKDQKGGNALGFVCTSPNIPDIAQVEPSCTYRPPQPAAKPGKK
ncbi:MAG: hypothetical protein ACTHMO_12615 [Rhodanobacteraceae bacterium]